MKGIKVDRPQHQHGHPQQEAHPQPSPRPLQCRPHRPQEDQGTQNSILSKKGRRGQAHPPLGGESSNGREPQEERGGQILPLKESVWPGNAAEA
ncbi:UNVERIFIED_CONTAM: hypothetical protein Sradi_1914900 [Sesamum radiatum]|uniref:Uncharacterized protein n=1 Tax=Sesamum radiatum TaxID=300843 RepID=A0AAW2TXX5_SESRA